jgi:hypothetical protein
MSLISDYGLDTPVRRLPLLLLSLEDGEGNKEMDGLHIHKIVKYYEYLSQKSDIEFSNYKLGAVSYELVENLDVLEETGLVEESTKGKLALSDEGEAAAKEIEADMRRDDIAKLQFAKKQLNDLTNDELLYFMYKLLPDTRQNSTEWARLSRRESELTRNLFRKGRISADTGAKWLGVTESEFVRTTSTQN